MTVIETEHRTEIVTIDRDPYVVETPAMQGPPGPPGASAPGGGGAPLISSDPDNRLVQGTDGGLHVLNDLTPDPLAYYILAKA